jgi:predicted nucleotidyltransferase
MIEEKQNIVLRLIELLKGKAEFALLFGSITNDNFNIESDIDIAIYFNSEFNTKEKKAGIRSEIFNSFDRDIDLIILNDADIIITMQVLANGNIIINENNSNFVLFKAKKISEYLDFKISRKIIEDNMLNGRIYT